MGQSARLTGAEPTGRHHRNKPDASEKLQICICALCLAQPGPCTVHPSSSAEEEAFVYLIATSPTVAKLAEPAVIRMYSPPNKQEDRRNRQSPRFVFKALFVIHSELEYRSRESCCFLC